MTAVHSEFLPRIVDVITDVGIPIMFASVPDGFLPGVEIRAGGLIVDEDRLAYAGDLLHEAAHIAVMAPDQRTLCDGGALNADPAEEMACHAWCYAAAKSFDLPLDVVFHDAYKAGGSWLREVFQDEDSILGQPMLQYWEMTRLPNSDESFDHLPLFPKMGKWLRGA